MTLSALQLVSGLIAGACLMFITEVYAMCLLKDQKKVEWVFILSGVGFLIYAVLLLAYSIWW